MRTIGRGPTTGDAHHERRGARPAPRRDWRHGHDRRRRGRRRRRRVVVLLLPEPFGFRILVRLLLASPGLVLGLLLLLSLHRLLLVLILTASVLLVLLSLQPGGLLLLLPLLALLFFLLPACLLFGLALLLLLLPGLFFLLATLLFLLPAGFAFLLFLLAALLFRLPAGFLIGVLRSPPQGAAQKHQAAAKHAKGDLAGQTHWALPCFRNRFGNAATQRRNRLRTRRTGGHRGVAVADDAGSSAASA